MKLNIKYKLFVWFASFIALLAAANQVIAASKPLLITVTKGFGVTLYASNLGDAKQLAIGDKGTVFVGSGKTGTVTALVDTDLDGRVEKRYVIAKGMKNPDAIAFHNGSLFVAVENRILRFSDIEQRLRRPGRPAVIYDNLPESKKRGSRTMHFGPDGRLYVAVGASCNVCEPETPLGSIIAIDVTSGANELIASGVRSVKGFDWSPTDDALWFADSGRDWMGDNIPADEINRVEQKGSHFGFPYLHGRTVVEPAYRKPKSLTITLPTFELPAHVEPVGVRFYRGTQFPEKYHDQLFVAENGSWNRSSKVGYQVVWLEVENNKVVKRNTLISFLDGAFPVARPYSLAIGHDGAMYISDDLKGNIYRLFYKNPPSPKPKVTGNKS
ncbi:L-sorbosone dehydrogenase [Parashewanella spongiae]|uniref:L-sorbosone dehydrogenase n=2 Tax=Parashewanella spongiae TaxID=342950 RepID=A0A3A6U0A5_9GAMM|nr:PQQ-dependent sugar dehydrogenase [Parashewanella spongiae]MCL1078328.1 PQQ-dependent sugar dehydrogenase [Parashewanella spongiae]RJY17497.1 L-sorbosone dehydrogenase [Parashewanella spongiae]